MNMDSLTASSISAPLKRRVASAKASNSCIPVWLFFERWMRKISFLSSLVGKSTKKISSKRPLRRNSGGNWLISFAVATTKTGFVFSCIHVSMVEKTRELVPPSLSPPTFRPFSISSIQRTQGATASAVAIARRILFSLLPTSAWNTLPTSRRNRGCFHSVATHFAVRLLPQPGTPRSIIPFGS